MDQDLAAIEAWASIFTDPVKLTETLTKNYLLHKNAINADVTAITTDWDSADYFQCGNDIAQLCIDAIGPITPAQAFAFLQ